MKKRILSLVLATLLIATMAIPASATSISTGRTWNGFIYQTNDTCNTGSFYCVIESTETDYTLATNVEVYARGTVNGQPDYICTGRYFGTPSLLISQVRGSSDILISHIYCYHNLSGTQASIQKVNAS